MLSASGIECIEQLYKTLANVTQLGYGVEAAYGCGLIVAYGLLGGLDFQPLVFDEIAYKAQFFNVFGCVQTRAALATLGTQGGELAFPKAQGRLRFADDVGYIADFVVKFVVGVQSVIL